MVGVNSILQALKESTDTVQATITTTELAANQTHEISLTSDDQKVDEINFRPTGSDPIQEGKIYLVRPIVQSGSTDTDLTIYESSDRDDVDEVIRIADLSVNDAVQSFQPGSAQGVQFENQEEENQLYITLDENSGIDSVYTIRLRWSTVD